MPVNYMISMHSSWRCRRRGVRRYRDESGQLEWRDDDTAQTELKASVEQVLRLMYEEHYEVPFIGMYRKEVSNASGVWSAQLCM